MTAATAAALEPWMSLSDAASYAGVPLLDMLGAVGRRELPAVTSLPNRLGEWMVRAHDVEEWAERRAELTMAG